MAASARGDTRVSLPGFVSMNALRPISDSSRVTRCQREVKVVGKKPEVRLPLGMRSISNQGKVENPTWKQNLVVIPCAIIAAETRPLP